MSHEDLHAPHSSLGPPLVQGKVEIVGSDGSRRSVEVAVWGAPDAPWEGAITWRGWLFIAGHSDYDPPRRVLGGSRFQVVFLAFDVIRRFCDEHDTHLLLD